MSAASRVGFIAPVNRTWVFMNDIAVRPSTRMAAAVSGPETNGSGVLDARLHAMQGRLSDGLSPVGQYLAWLNRGLHLANAPNWRDRRSGSGRVSLVRLGGSGRFQMLRLNDLV